MTVVVETRELPRVMIELLHRARHPEHMDDEHVRELHAWLTLTDVAPRGVYVEPYDILNADVEDEDDHHTRLARWRALIARMRQLGLNMV